jgi:2-polyprenyl-3-methyl-5-hydroxy-6-metoxy-1,4-benzoquinol methylase
MDETMKRSDSDEPGSPVNAADADSPGSHTTSKQEIPERQITPSEWVLHQMATIDRGPAAGARNGALHQAARRHIAALARWLIQLPIVGRLFWWMKMTIKAPRMTVEILDHLAAIRDEMDGLRALIAENASQTEEQLALIRRLRLDVQDLKGENPVSESVYDAFEAEFRGDPKVISQRAEVYLPIIESVSAGIPSFPILDIGCGRGEWLRLLKDHGLAARGVDSSRTFAEKVRAQGLDVEEAEAVYYLTRAADDSVGAVTAFHIVEHLEMNALIALIRECYRIIRPGGVVILETPNPENIVVGSCSFYSDPTHRRPIPPQTLSFYLRNSGFSNVTVAGLSPLNLIEGPVGDAMKPIVERFNMGQDYAAIGYKLQVV